MPGDVTECDIALADRVASMAVCGRSVMDIAEAIAEYRRTPEPGTSVVRWVSWDYRRDGETLPESGQVVVVKLFGRSISGLATLEYDSIDRAFYWAFKGECGDWIAMVGDLWAALPEPPEESK